MTREEAIKILELETRQEALIPYLDRPMEKMLDAMIEASRMGASALRAQPAKLDRSRWEGCTWCGDKGIINCGIKVNQPYCPACGRPFTEEAWAELERRIGENNGTTDE